LFWIEDDDELVLGEKVGVLETDKLGEMELVVAQKGLVDWAQSQYAYKS